MAAKRPSKAERQRRNRARRDAREARSARAGEATELARGRDAADDSVEPGEPSAPERSSRAKAVRPGRGGAGVATVPGQRAVLLSFLFSLVSIALLVLLPVSLQREVPVDDPRVVEQDVEVEEGDETATIVEDVKLIDEESLAVALAVMLTPVAVTGVAVAATRNERRSTYWTMCMLALAAYVFFIGGAYAIYTLPPLVALGVGGFQARRAEGKERMAEIKAKREARDGAESRAGKDVIDVDAVEETDDDER